MRHAVVNALLIHEARATGPGFPSAPPSTPHRGPGRPQAPTPRQLSPPPDRRPTTA